MATVSMTYAREHFAELCERAYFHDETVLITKGRQDRVAIIPVKTLALLEQIERALDRAGAQQALEAVRTGAPTLSLEDLQRALGSAAIPHPAKTPVGE